MIRTKISGFTVALCLFSTYAFGHELWIAPADYQVVPGVSTTAHLLNGERFAGSTIYYNPGNTVRLDRVHKGAATAIKGRLGDEPAIRLSGLQSGLHALVYQSKPSKLYYKTWAKFAKFAGHKDFPDIEDRHKARKLPRDGFREVYTRYSKALIAVGDGKGADRAVGLDTEIVALANPYTTTASVLPVRVLYNGKPRANAQIEYFAKAPDNTVKVTLHRTNADGVARLPIQRGYQYLVDAVVLREPSRDRAAEFESVWETLWASLTFAVPK